MSCAGWEWWVVVVGGGCRGPPSECSLRPPPRVAAPHLHLDGLLGPRAALRLEQRFVVQSQLQLRHARQVRPHLDGAQDLGGEHGAVGRDEQVELLHDVQEHLVLLVLDVLRAPGDLVRHRLRRLGHRQLVRALRDVLLQHLELRYLRVAKVHDLVQQLVDQHEVVADGLLLQRLEVALHDLHQPLQEHKHGGHVGVALGGRQDVDVVVLQVHVVDAALGEDGLQIRGVRLLHLLREPAAAGWQGPGARDRAGEREGVVHWATR
jgi:hypothetical protein